VGGRIPDDFLDHTLVGNTGVLSESIAQTETIDWDKVGDSSGRSKGAASGVGERDNELGDHL
jgi:hypothetical protein